jgi:hypothetical protein
MLVVGGWAFAVGCSVLAISAVTHYPFRWVPAALSLGGLTLGTIGFVRRAALKRWVGRVASGLHEEWKLVDIRDGSRAVDLVPLFGGIGGPITHVLQKNKRVQ